MEGGSNGTSCLMGFGENASTMMMMPSSFLTTTTTTSHHHHHQINPNLNDHNNNHHHHNNTTTNANTNSSLFLPMMPSSSTNNNHHPDPNRNNITSFMLESNHTTTNNNNINTGLGCYFMESSDHNNNGSSSSSSSCAVKAKIMAHPHYHRLLAAYVNCQKVGAPPEVVARLEEACASAASMAAGSACIGEDPALDQFMEAYCEMLTKYEQELSKPLKEAMLFLHRIESQFKNLTISSSSSSDFAAAGGGGDRNGSSEEDVDIENMIDPQAEDRELKGQLLRKYSGYLGSLKQEFMKKRKKGKLPKEARQQLLEWWSRHYKWPYPSESQKLALAESTGLDQKQINNWFINQRKRHWKPSEDMQFVVVDPTHPHYYMDNVLTNPFPMDLSNTML